MVTAMADDVGSKESRRRIRVPAKDRTVIEWMDEQEDLSASLRLVVRDYIRRYGVGDVMCQPVQQEPRRGRPPKQESEVTENTEPSDGDEVIEDRTVKAVSVPEKNVVKTAPSTVDVSGGIMDMLNE